jgi:hypothetical protein
MTTSTVEIISDTREELMRIAGEITSGRDVVSESYSRQNGQWRGVIVYCEYPAALDEI